MILSGWELSQIEREFAVSEVRRDTGGERVVYVRRDDAMKLLNEVRSRGARVLELEAALERAAQLCYAHPSLASEIMELAPRTNRTCPECGAMTKMYVWACNQHEFHHRHGSPPPTCPECKAIRKKYVWSCEHPFGGEA
mgnify:CR=1 FL=1